MYFEKPMNIQLFAEEGDTSATDTNSENTQKDTGAKNTENMVSKELFDNARSEIAELKKQMREMQKTGKSEAELKDLDLKEKEDELAKRGKELNDLYLKLNYANACANIAEAKAKIKLDNDKDLDLVLNAIVTNNGEETTSRSKAFSDLLTAVYEKGVADAKTQEWSGMTDGVKSGGSSGNNTMVDFVKSISKNNSIDTSGIKDKFK